MTAAIPLLFNIFLADLLILFQSKVCGIDVKRQKPITNNVAIFLEIPVFNISPYITGSRIGKLYEFLDSNSRKLKHLLKLILKFAYQLSVNVSQ